MYASKNGTEAAKDSIDPKVDCLFRVYDAEATGSEPALPTTTYEWMNGKKGGSVKAVGHTPFVGHAS